MSNKALRKSQSRAARSRPKRAPGRPEPVSSTDVQRPSKKAQIIELLRRPEGATVQELCQATGWQPHSLRGFISGTLAKKLGHKITRAKRDDGAGVYLLTE